MRRLEREIKNRETIAALLERSQVGRIATINRKGFPVMKPVNFLYWDGKIYIHSSTQGEKIRNIQRGSPICFEVDEPIAYAPATGPACMAGYYYRSLVMKGKAHLLKDHQRKSEVLERLMGKYQPEGGYDPIPKEGIKRTAVIEISIEEMSGKERLG